MTVMTDYSHLYPRLEPTSDRSVTVYDRPRSEPGAVVIGTVAATGRGVEAHRPHYSLRDRHAAELDGAPFPTIGDGVAALVTAYDESDHGSWEVV